MSERKTNVINGMFVFKYTDRAIPLKHARIIKKNLDSGVEYWAASPVYDLTREEAAQIINVAWKELQR